RIGIAGPDHDPRYARVDHRLRAGRRPSNVVARLERHVQRRVARTLARLPQRDRLGVLDVRVLVPALAHDLVVAHDDCADERMILDLATSALRELERALERVHASSCTRRRYARGRSSREKIELPATNNRAPAS